MRQGDEMKRAALYARVSTPDQHLETQLYDLRKLAAQRGYHVVREYCDRGVSGTKAKRPGLDSLMADARRGEFSVLLRLSVLSDFTNHPRVALCAEPLVQLCLSRHLG
jgi:DNA invertase Pin-like site-specific DNA recombinase